MLYVTQIRFPFLQHATSIMAVQVDGSINGACLSYFADEQATTAVQSVTSNQQYRAKPSGQCGSSCSGGFYLKPLDNTTLFN
jgi:hypothetical protein